MTLAGDGSSNAFAYRVTIDGCPVEAVTHPSMVRTGSYEDGIAYRYDGLMMAGQKFEASADLIACGLTVGGLRLRIADVAAAWSTVFDRAPSVTTWLTTDVNASASTIPVLSTTGFSSTGVVFLDGESLCYKSVGATSFTSVTRGCFSTDADAETYHYTGDGKDRRNPEVTDWIVLWEGRRVRVFRYEETDLLTGDGTQVYLGKISSSPTLNGTTWSIGVDSIVGVLDQMIGADLSSPASPRGISYPEGSPYSMTIIDYTGLDAWGTQSAQAPVYLAGFYEDQEAFCVALNAAIAAAQATASPVQTNLLVAMSDGDAGYHFEYSTLAGGSARAMRVIGTATADNLPSFVDPRFGGEGGRPQTADGQRFLGNVVASTRYYFFASGAPPAASGVTPDTLAPTGIPGAGTVPRGTIITSGGVNARRIRLGGATPISSLVNSVQIEWAGSDEDPTTVAISALSSGSRYIDLPIDRRRPVDPAGFHYYTSASLPKLSFSLGLSASTTGSASSDLMAFLVANQQQYSPLGVVPQIRTLDYDATVWAANAKTGQPDLVTKRVYSTFAPVSLRDIITPELQLAGCFLAVDSTGRLVPKRMRLPAPSEVSTASTITTATLLTDDVMLAHEVCGLGQINQVVLRTGYDPVTDKTEGRTWIVRDVAAFGQSPTVRQVAIEPKSVYIGAPITDSDMVDVAAGYFGTFAGSYAVDTIDAALHDSVTLGDAIVFDHPHMPDEDGVIGVTGKVGLVIGRTTEAYSPRARLTVLSHKQAIAGYAQSALISGQVNTSANIWTMTPATTFYPSGTTDVTWWTVGDRVQITKWDTTTNVTVAGIVTASVAGTVTVNFDGVWTPSTDTWYLKMADSTDSALATLQRRFASVAGSTGIVDYATNDQSAFRFGA